MYNEAERWASDRFGSLNPVRYLGCGTGTTCHYVLWKSLDMLISSTVLLVVAVVVVTLTLAYLVWRGPLTSHSYLQWQQFLALQKLSGDRFESPLQIPVYDATQQHYTLSKRTHSPTQQRAEGEA